MVLRRVICAVISIAAICSVVIWVVPCGPVAAGSSKRNKQQGQPALAGPSTGGQRQDTKDKRRDDEPPEEETEQQRRQRWERVFRGRDRTKMIAVIQELSTQETEEATELLVAFVRRTRDPRLQVLALGALGWRGNRPALDFLKGKHGALSARSEVAAAACRAIGRVGDAASRAFLLERVDGKDPVVAAGALGGIVALDRRAFSLPDLLQRCSVHESEEVRAEVAASLAVARVEDWSTRLVTLCDDPAPAVRVAACETLARRVDEATAPVLLRLQSDDVDEAVRAAALRALVAIEEALTAD